MPTQVPRIPPRYCSLIDKTWAPDSVRAQPKPALFETKDGAGTSGPWPGAPAHAQASLRYPDRAPTLRAHLAINILAAVRGLEQRAVGATVVALRRILVMDRLLRNFGGQCHLGACAKNHGGSRGALRAAH